MSDNPDQDSGGITAQLYDATGTRVGGEFLVNTTTLDQQLDPTVSALANGGFVIAWTDLSGRGDSMDGAGVRVQMYDANSARVGSEILVSETYSNQAITNALTPVVPDVAGLTNGGFVVTWTQPNVTGSVGLTDPSTPGTDASGTSIKAQLYDADGVSVGGELLVNTATYNNQAWSTITALANGGFVITWSDWGATVPGRAIKAQLYDATAARVGDEFLVTDVNGPQLPEITWLASGDFVVSWTDFDAATGNDIKAQIFSIAGEVFPDQVSPEDTAWSFTFPAGTFTDVDSPILTLTATLADGAALPGWLNFDGDSRTFSGTPPADFTGSLEVKVSASDGEFSVSDTFQLTISPVNDAPVLAEFIADQVSPEDTAWSFVVPAGSFSDVDSATLVLTATLADGAALPGWLSFDAASRTFSGTPPLNLNGSLDLKVTASDGELSASDTFQVTITAVNDAPTAVDDAVAVDEDATTANLWATLLSNDTDVDLGDALSIVSVSGASNLGGTLVLDTALHSLTYTADADILDLLAAGATAADSFTYTVRDAAGATSQATVSVTITGVGDGTTILGTIKIDTLTGTTGDDTIRADNGADVVRAGAGADLVDGGNGGDSLFGEAGMDRLFGDSGDDWLDGGLGNDRLDGGRGNDLLTGGLGRDIFTFGASSGADSITDFTAGQDALALVDGVALLSQSVSDVNSDGVADTVLTLNNGGSIALLGVTSLGSIDLFG